jgi:hypothetical protein
MIWSDNQLKLKWFQMIMVWNENDDSFKWEWWWFEMTMAWNEGDFWNKECDDQGL